MKLWLHALCFLTFATLGHAMAAALQLEHAAKVADAIVHCKIVGTEPAAKSESRYRHLAHARVLASAKGASEGETLVLLFDNGLGCPNVHYSRGEEVLVFLQKTASGNYETMHTYCGRFSVENGIAKSISLFAPRPPKPKDYPIDEALRLIRQAVP